MSNLSAAGVALALAAGALGIYWAARAFLKARWKGSHNGARPASITAAGLAVLVGGVALATTADALDWGVPRWAGALGRQSAVAMLNLGAALVVVPWVVRVVAADLVPKARARGVRASEHRLAVALHRIVSEFGGAVIYDSLGPYDFLIEYGDRVVAIEFGALTHGDQPGTYAAGWHQRISELSLQPDLVVLNEAMQGFLTKHGLPGFERSMVWKDDAETDLALQDAVCDLVFGMSSEFW